MTIAINELAQRIQKDLGENLYSLLAESLTTDFSMVNLKIPGKIEIRISADEEWYCVETCTEIAIVTPKELRELFLIYSDKRDQG